VFATHFAECLSRDAPFNFTQDHMGYFRRRMTYELLQAQLMNDT
jgi:sentrin-specific protease 1